MILKPRKYYVNIVRVPSAPIKRLKKKKII